MAKSSEHFISGLRTAYDIVHARMLILPTAGGRTVCGAIKASILDEIERIEREVS